VATVEDGRSFIESPLGTILSNQKAEVAAGQAVTVSIRPESIRVVEGGFQGTHNVFRGRLESLVFVGEACEGEIRIGSTLLIVRLDATASVKEGDEITLHFDPDHCSVLSG
jgi:iron(III) transport system ATP-binding protein